MVVGRCAVTDYGSGSFVSTCVCDCGSGSASNMEHAITTSRVVDATNYWGYGMPVAEQFESPCDWGRCKLPEIHTCMMYSRQRVFMYGRLQCTGHYIVYEVVVMRKAAHFRPYVCMYVRTHARPNVRTYALTFVCVYVRTDVGLVIVVVGQGMSTVPHASVRGWVQRRFAVGSFLWYVRT